MATPLPCVKCRAATTLNLLPWLAVSQPFGLGIQFERLFAPQSLTDIIGGCSIPRLLSGLPNSSGSS
jgi:hypothetical protein